MFARQRERRRLLLLVAERAVSLVKAVVKVAPLLLFKRGGTALASIGFDMPAKTGSVMVSPAGGTPGYFRG